MNEEVTTKLHKEKPSDEFTFWYERFYLQSPRLCSLKYDDEKMWEAWQVAYKLGRDNAYKRKDIPIEIFTIPKEKHIHTMNKDTDAKTDND
jgi:hypothetical protein